jgi:hypothetical protein
MSEYENVHYEIVQANMQCYLWTLPVILFSMPQCSTLTKMKNVFNTQNKKSYLRFLIQGYDKVTHKIQKTYSINF